MATGRPTGRPCKLHHRIAAPTDEDASRVITIAEFIPEQMAANGRSAVAQADLAGLDRVTIQAWIRKGAAAEVRKGQNKLLYPDEVRFLDFLIATRAAHSRWAATQLATHHSIANGGLSTVEVTEKVNPLVLVAGADGQERPQVIERRVKTTRLLPDVKALEWELEHLARDEFPRRIEVTGKDGGPVEVAETSLEDRARSLMAEVDAYELGVADGREREAEVAKSNGMAGS